LEVAYVRQNLANLRFGLYNRTLDPGWFRIFRQRSMERAGYQAEFWVIGTSHVMNVWLTAAERSPGTALAEVLTAAGGSLPAEGRIALIEEWRHRGSLQQVTGRLRYSAQLDSLTYPEEAFRERVSCLLPESGPHRLTYHFPREEGLIAAPTTLIDVLRADEDALEIQTFHTYPEELTIVVTHSVVEVTPTQAGCDEH
jgi:hypothetical protein